MITSHDPEAATARILAIAERLVGQRHAALAWFRHDRIHCLGQLTAEELVERGRAQDVVSFLCRIEHLEQRKASVFPFNRRRAS